MKQPVLRSLLPYLHSPNCGVQLKMLQAPALPRLRPETPSPFPFLCASTSDPLTRLVRAQFETDSGSIIKRVFLLLQRDSYAFSDSQASPVSNADVEAFWQEAFALFRSNPSCALTTLSCRQNGRDRLEALQPLFFCRAKEIFFHPPCPKCGQALQLCRDESILTTYGLQPYSSSLNRYLYCSSCLSSGGEAVFYAYETGSFDPPVVWSRTDLIKEFGLLLRNGSEACGLPCLDCLDNKSCFGSEMAAASLIAPFAFYPFFMMIFDSMSLSGPDFVALLSGASSVDLEARARQSGELGRALLLEEFGLASSDNPPFLFAKSDKWFLEALYLKLAFLGELMRKFPPEPRGGGISYPLVSLDSLWVNMTDKSGLLPYFWNFEVAPAGLPRGPLEMFPRLKLPAPYSLHYWGVLWFQTLLVNSEQDIGALNKALEKLCAQLNPGEEPPEEVFRVNPDPAFSPKNLFWEPSKARVDDGFLVFWENALDLGWSLFTASFYGYSRWSKEKFLQQLASLRESIKNELFFATSRDMEAPQLDDPAIGDILGRIHDRWRSRMPVEADEEIEDKTIIQAAPVPEAQRNEVWDDISEETILTKPFGFEEATLRLTPKSKNVEEDLPETMIITPGEARRLTPASIEPSSAGYEPTGSYEEDLPETMILTPAGKKGAPASLPPEPSREPDIGDERTIHGEDELPETIILSPSPGRRTPEGSHQKNHLQNGLTGAQEPVNQSRKKPVEEEDDLLMETIILHPSKSDDKDGKKNDG